MSKALKAATAALAKTRGPGTSASGFKLRAGDIQGDPVRDGFIAPTRPPAEFAQPAAKTSSAPVQSAALATPAPAATVRTEKIDEDSAGQRIDNFLLNLLKGAPRSLIYRILRSGEVRVNGKKVKPEVRLEEDDQVRIPPVQIEDRDPGQAPAGLLAQVPGWVIFEDRLFLVLNKPSGIAAHGGSGISFGAIELVRQWRPKETFELVHRLDRDTSGVLVMAKRRSGLTALQAVMRENKIEKHYLALLAGRVQHDRQKVDVALAKNMLRGGERMVMVDEDGKDSLSIFNVVERLPGATLVDVQIKTGRTHQIRVHAQHLGHPVLGDEKYGDEAANKGAKHWGLKRMFLHAKSFAFSLPDQEYAFTAPLADELRTVVDRLQAK
ncbi:MAG: RluA family pseudouridine synthase [Ahniella sp.]|nr:RluA family pseudouridine synthase [Ahniella sp.]